MQKHGSLFIERIVTGRVVAFHEWATFCGINRNKLALKRVKITQIDWIASKNQFIRLWILLFSARLLISNEDEYESTRMRIEKSFIFAVRAHTHTHTHTQQQPSIGTASMQLALLKLWIRLMVCSETYLFYLLHNCAKEFRMRAGTVCECFSLRIQFVFCFNKIFSITKCGVKKTKSFEKER